MGIGCCLLVAAGVIGFAATLVGPFGPVIVTAAILVVAAAIVRHQLHRLLAAREFRATYGEEGKDVLIVYTDSPHWGAYIEANWLPRWGERAVVLNRSLPWSPEQVDARLWRAVAGNAEHTPVVIVVSANGRARIVRFWRAFRDYQHGFESALISAENELELILSE
jgi:hypothetical protein